jgi:hypothetical protein
MKPCELKHVHKQVPNWMFPYLIMADNHPIYGNQRWAYWESCVMDIQLPDEPIPPINFQMPHSEPIRNIADCIRVGEQQGGRHAQVFELFVIWLLHGFGNPRFRQYETAADLPGMGHFLNANKVLDHWYENFNLCLMLQHPADYMAFFSQGGANGDRNPYTGSGFFATPMSVSTMMARMTFEGQGDCRAKKTLDCCAGTGSLLLAASNYSLRLYAQDISQAMCNCIAVNAYLYMPWMVFHPDFSRFGGPTWEQVEEAMFGQPEPAAQREIIQLPLFTSELEPALAIGQKQQPDAVLEGFVKAFEWLREVEEEINAHRLIYADEYSYEWRLSEQMYQAKRRMVQPDFAQKKMEKAA